MNGEDKYTMELNKYTKKYKIIYADPPWHFKHWNDDTVNRKAPYPVMSPEDIYALDVQHLADDDCILFLWATYPKLPEALETIKHWGFEYKTVGFTWVKKNKKADSWFWGMGYWTRANAEICIIATKGKPKRISAGVHQIVDDRIMEHSRKPDTVRQRIVELVGDLPRIELFARQKPDGWDVWGNEV